MCNIKINKNMKKIFILSLCIAFFAPLTVLGVSGANMDNIYVEIRTNQGDDWFTARTVKTDDDSSLRLKDVLPGKYRFELDDDDVKNGQKLGLELKIKDAEGKDIKEDTNVDAYIFIGNTKVFINTFETNNSGWLKLEGITPGITYELDVKGDGKVKSKNDLARIKTKAQIDNSAWFYSSYDRLELDTSGQTNGILEMTDVLSGKYKFKVKSGDLYDPAKPFIVKAQLRRNNGKNIKELTAVSIYAYPYGIKTKVAEVMTDAKGWIILPQVQPNMKYRLKIKD